MADNTSRGGGGGTAPRMSSPSVMRQRVILRSHTLEQAVLVAKYGESFPNCVISNQRNCMEGGGCGDKGRHNEKDFDPESGEKHPDRFILPCGKKVVIGLPFVARDAFLYMRTSHLKLFYADVVLVPLWWIAFVVVVAVSVDALTDPVSGSLADQLRSRWGRRRPLLAVGSVIMSLLFLLLWMPCVFGLCPAAEDYDNLQCNDGSFGKVEGSWIFLFIVYLLYFISLDLVVVSLEAFAAELTPSYSDRNCLFGVAMVFSVIGVALGVVLPPLVAEDQPQIQFVYTAGAFAAYMIVVSWVASCTLKERGVVARGDQHKRAKKTIEGAGDGVGADDGGTIELTDVKSPTAKPAAAAGGRRTAEVLEEEAQEIEAAAAATGLGIADLEILDAEDLDVVDLTQLSDNTGLVPGFISSFRNKTFRVLVVSEILESLGDQLQYTVLPFVVKYVVMPTSMSVGNAYSLLAGLVLVFEGCSVPFWMWMAQRYGKWHTYVAWNFALTVGTGIKIIIGREADVGIAPTMVAAALWGFSLGGSRHIMRSMVADSIDYDELLSGQRREGQYSIFIDFIPKLAEVPSTVVPLLVMAAFGYAPNAAEQNADVYWTILVCFSLAPAFFSLLGAAVLFGYPKTARQGMKTLSAVQDGIVLHAAGKDAYDPIAETMVTAPQCIRAAIGGAAHEVDMQHFFFSELRAVAKHKDKRQLVLHTGLWLTLYVVLAATTIGLCVWDWHENIDPIFAAGETVCNTYTTQENCAGFNDSLAPCATCASGFWGPTCAPCPGLIDRPDDALDDFVGYVCNNHGTCNATSGTCTCDDDGWSGAWCGVNVEKEPFAMFPVYIAFLGVWVFFIAFHALRLGRATLVVANATLTVEMIAAYAAIAEGRPLTPEERKLQDITDRDAKEATRHTQVHMFGACRGKPRPGPPADEEREPTAGNDKGDAEHSAGDGGAGDQPAVEGGAAGAKEGAAGEGESEGEGKSSEAV